VVFWFDNAEVGYFSTYNQIIVIERESKRRFIFNQIPPLKEIDFAQRVIRKTILIYQQIIVSVTVLVANPTKVSREVMLILLRARQHPDNPRRIERPRRARYQQESNSETGGDACRTQPSWMAGFIPPVTG